MWKCPDLDEVSKVISMFHDRNSPSSDGLHPELIKKGGKRLVKVLDTIIRDARENLEVSAGWKDAQLQEERDDIVATTVGFTFLHT